MQSTFVTLTCQCILHLPLKLLYWHKNERYNSCNFNVCYQDEFIVEWFKIKNIRKKRFLN